MPRNFSRTFAPIAADCTSRPPVSRPWPISSTSCPRVSKLVERSSKALAMLPASFRRPNGSFVRSGRDCFTRRALLWLSFGEFETDFSIFQFEARREWAPFLGNKLRKKIGFADCNQLLHLLLRNFAVQDVLADPEGAGFFLGNRVLAGIGAIKDVNLAFLANWTKSERLVLLSVDLYRLIVAVLAEVEGRFEIFAQLDGGVEFAPDFASKTLERTNLFLS